MNKFFESHESFVSERSRNYSLKFFSATMEEFDKIYNYINNALYVPKRLVIFTNNRYKSVFDKFVSKLDKEVVLITNKDVLGSGSRSVMRETLQEFIINHTEPGDTIYFNDIMWNFSYTNKGSENGNLNKRLIFFIEDIKRLCKDRFVTIQYDKEYLDYVKRDIYECKTKFSYNMLSDITYREKSMFGHSTHLFNILDKTYVELTDMSTDNPHFVTFGNTGALHGYLYDNFKEQYTYLKTRFKEDLLKHFGDGKYHDFEEYVAYAKNYRQYNYKHRVHDGAKILCDISRKSGLSIEVILTLVLNDGKNDALTINRLMNYIYTNSYEISNGMNMTSVHLTDKFRSKYGGFVKFMDQPEYKGFSILYRNGVIPDLLQWCADGMKDPNYLNFGKLLVNNIDEDSLNTYLKILPSNVINLVNYAKN